PVTRIEQWIANPYAIFARDILRLEPLPPLAGQADSRLRGIIIHDVLNAFARGFPEALPEDIAAALMRLAEEQLRQAGADARSAVFWRPHLRRFARWFAMIEPQLRAGVSRVVSETPGSLDLELPETPFTLTARADRIDMRKDGSLALYDYKSGEAPREQRVADLRAPQLPLEAAIASRGGFEGVPGQPVSRLAYIRFLGRGDGGALIALGKKEPGELADKAVAQLEALVRAYADPRQPYRALRRALFANSAQYRYDDYAHLARVAEWSAGEGGDEG
ncbi:MAG: double-strand break repair protein AddB, partial [Alphaproteobacteria bacterium]